MASDPDALRLARAIIEMDARLPRGRDMADDAPRPAWCHVFCEAMDSPGGECCGICGTLSEATRKGLDKAFREGNERKMP